MIFYEVEDGANGHYLVGTQADAKREARERKCTWSQVNIPTDKDGLMHYINGLETAHGEEAAVLQAVIDEEMGVEHSKPPINMASVAAAQARAQNTMTQIAVEEFIQNASPIQLASCASNVCSRMHELAKTIGGE